MPKVNYVEIDRYTASVALSEPGDPDRPESDYTDYLCVTTNMECLRTYFIDFLQSIWTEKCSDFGVETGGFNLFAVCNSIEKSFRVLLENFRVDAEKFLSGADMSVTALQLPSELIDKHRLLFEDNFDGINPFFHSLVEMDDVSLRRFQVNCKLFIEGWMNGYVENIQGGLNKSIETDLTRQKFFGTVRDREEAVADWKSGRCKVYCQGDMTGAVFFVHEISRTLLDQNGCHTGFGFFDRDRVQRGVALYYNRDDLQDWRIVVLPNSSAPVEQRRVMLFYGKQRMTDAERQLPWCDVEFRDQLKKSINCDAVFYRLRDVIDQNGAFNPAKLSFLEFVRTYKEVDLPQLTLSDDWFANPPRDIVNENQLFGFMLKVNNEIDKHKDDENVFRILTGYKNELEKILSPFYGVPKPDSDTDAPQTYEAVKVKIEALSHEYCYNRLDRLDEPQRRKVFLAINIITHITIVGMLFNLGHKIKTGNWLFSKHSDSGMELRRITSGVLRDLAPSA